MNFEPWMLAAIDEAGFNGVEDEHIRRVAAELHRMGTTYIDRQTFDSACFRAGVDPDNFGQEDLDELERVLNEG